MTGSYKDGTGLGKSGWEVQKGFLPTRLGGWFIDFEFKVEELPESPLAQDQDAMLGYFHSTYPMYWAERP